MNSRLRRRVSRAVNMALEQESKKRRDGSVQLRDRTDWLESEREKQSGGQSKMWTSGASGRFRGPGSSRVKDGIPGIGEASSCEVFQSTINCFSIRWCSRISWALKSVTAIWVAEKRRSSAAVRCGAWWSCHSNVAGGEEQLVSLQLTTATSSCFVGLVKFPGVEGKRRNEKAISAGQR